MAKRWLDVALLAACWCWSGVAAQAQFGLPGGGGSPGPMKSCLAPPGPDNDMGLPADLPNAFTDPIIQCHDGVCCNGMWFSVEYLLWVLRDPDLPTPLVTSGGGGVLPATNILLAQDGIDYPPFSGGRVSAGFWLDCDRVWSLEGSGFVLEDTGDNIGFVSDGGVELAIPFFDIAANAESRLLVAGAGAAGAIDVQQTSQLWGAEANLVYLPDCMALIVGFRYVDLAENLEIVSGRNAGVLRDHFGTRNQFYGGQFGLRYACNNGCFFWGAQATVAIGGNHQTLLIFGENTVAGVTTPGALFARATNSGRFNEDEFAYIPEGQFKLGYQVNRNITLTAGYTFLYWQDVRRPADQIDRRTFQPGAAVDFRGPLVTLNERDFWAHGLSLGLEMRY